MPFQKTDIPGLLVFEPRVFEDSRGYFFEAYNEHSFQQEGINIRFVQDNQSKSSHGVIRGLHYQLPPYTQTKLAGILLLNCLRKTKSSCSFRPVLHTGFQSSATRPLCFTNVISFTTKKVKGAYATMIHRSKLTGK
jgi:hypothetical protein